MGGRMKPDFYKTFVAFLLVVSVVIVFAAPSFAGKPLGAKCAGHYECTSGRCDNRAQAGCVPQDGTGNSGEFCTTHQQCRSQLCTITPGKITGQCSGVNKPLGSPCSTHNECVSRRCDNRPGAGCVAQDGTGNANEFCTTHQQCRSGYCQVTSGLRGTCSAGGQAIGRPCHVSSECTSKYCDKGVCAQPGSTPPPAASTCPGAKSFQGYVYVGQPSCAGVMGGYLRCDAKGYFCCASSAGSQSPRCGGTGKYEYQPGCSQYSSGGGTNIGPLLRDGIFYGCYKPTF